VLIFTHRSSPEETVTAAFADNETWHVLMAADDMKRMNVEQLDDAFRLSLIDASTLVWQAGMQGWRRLGSIADVEDDPEESIETWAAASPPRPATHAAQTQLLAPVYAPAMSAVDPFVFSQRRAELPDEVDFRRASGSVRWGRRLVALLLITGGVLGAYRQNLLRDGARRIGIESQYLTAEQRVSAFVRATAPTPVKRALERLALLPGPNALPQPVASFDSTPVAATLSPKPVTPTSVAPVAAPPPCVAVPVAVAKEPKEEPEVKTVSFDSLPVLRRGSPEAKPLALRDTARSQSNRPAAEKASAAPRSSKKKARTEAPIAKAAPKTKPQPKPHAAPRPPADDNPLNAAMRRVVASDAKKLTARE
jgi:hypothetical protein